MIEPAFFTRDGEYLVPNDCARGPWSVNTLHGRLIIGVLGAEIEQRHGSAEYMPARLTTDLHRMPSMSPLRVTSHVVRDGHRIKVVEAELLSEGRSVGRASCQLLRRTRNPPGRIWSAPEWSAPAPAEIPDPGDSPINLNGMWEYRPIIGEIGLYGRRCAWLREVRALVAGERLTPFARVAAGADYASPLVNASDAGLGFINSDLTLYLHRLPLGEWIGYEAIAQGATDGVAVGECHVYDEQGRIGSATVCALAQVAEGVARRRE